MSHPHTRTRGEPEAAQDISAIERNARAHRSALEALSLLFNDEPSPVKTEFDDNVTEWTEGTFAAIDEDLSRSCSAVDKEPAELTERTEGTFAAVDVEPSSSSFALCPVCSGALQPIPVGIDFWEPVKNHRYLRVMIKHAGCYHPEEPLWNALPVLDLQAPTPKRRKGDDGTAVPTRAKNNVASVAGLVGYALRKAAVALPLRKEVDWYRSWTCVRALMCARIGGAVHSVCGNNKLYFKNRTCVHSDEGLKGPMIVQFRWVKTEALRYLCALIEKVMYSIEPAEWKTYNNGRRMNMIQVFFHNGAKHHRVGLISADQMPPSAHFPAILTCPRLGLAISAVSKPTDGGHREIQGSVKCPICDRALPFLCASTDFGKSIRVNSTIRDAIDQHCNTYGHEPLWNCLPMLALKPMNWENRRREKVTSGCVETFLDYTLRNAARAIPLPAALGTWITDWTFTKCVLLARLNFARERTSDPFSFMKDWTNVSAAGKSNDAKRAWIRRSAKEYIQQLIENVISLDVASGEKWEMASISRRRNTFQLFFLQGNHRGCGLLKTSLFPALPDVAATEPKPAEAISDHGKGDQHEGDNEKLFPDEEILFPALPDVAATEPKPAEAISDHGKGDQHEGDNEKLFPDEEILFPVLPDVAATEPKTAEAISDHGKGDQHEGDNEKLFPDEEVLCAGGDQDARNDENPNSDDVLRAGDVIDFYTPIGRAGDPVSKRTAIITSIDPGKSGGCMLDLYPHQILLNSHLIRRKQTLRDGKLCDHPSYYHPIEYFTLEQGDIGIDATTLYSQHIANIGAQVGKIIDNSRDRLEEMGFGGQWLRDFKPTRKEHKSMDAPMS